MEISVVLDNHFVFTVRISTNQRNSFLVHFVNWLFHALQNTRQLAASKLSYKHDIL